MMKKVGAIRKAVGIFAGARDVIKKNCVVIPRRHMRIFTNGGCSPAQRQKDDELDREEAKEKAAEAAEARAVLDELEKASSERPVVFRALRSLPDSVHRYISSLNFASECCAVFRDRLYELHGPLTDDEFVLLTWREFEREERFFARIRERTESSAQPAASPRPSIPAAVRREVWKRDGACCTECGRRTDLEYDHLIPISRGGSSTVRNVRLLCEPCNRRKGDRI